MLPVLALGAVRGQVPQQHVSVHGVQASVILGEPAGKVQQVERVGPDSPRRVAPVGHVTQEVVDQRQLARARQLPAPGTHLGSADRRQVLTHGDERMAPVPPLGK